MFLPKADRTAAPFPISRLIRPPAIRTALLFLGCIGGAVSTLGQIAQPDDQPRKLTGTVINAVTEAPIPRALVVSSDNRFAMLTDAEGHFEFAIPDNAGTDGQGAIPREYTRLGNCSWVRARKPGFLDDCSEPRGVSKPSVDDHTIALIPEALIHGRVTLPDSDRLFGTRVQLFFRDVNDGLPRWIPMRGALTNSAGEFRFSELRSGEYRLLMHERADNDPVVNGSTKSYGYPPVYYPNAPDFPGAATIHLDAGESVEADISALRQPYYRVTIPVANSDISSGMNVTVEAESGPGYSLGYNASAKQIEGLLPTGNYVVTGTTSNGDDSRSGTVHLKVNAAPAEGPAMMLVRDSSIVLDVKEEFIGTWSGNASFSNGRRTFALRGPRAYLNPRLESVDDLEPMHAGAMRPPSGPNDTSIVLENVAPGHYWLRLTTSRGYVASARMGDVDLLHEPLVVAAGASAPVEIEMRDDTAEIDGTVSGLPSSAGTEYQPTSFQVWIYCVPLADSAGQYQQLVASEDGRFTQPLMAPGGYRLLAFAGPQPHLPYRDAEAMKAYETKGPVVQLTAGQKISVQVPLIADSDLPQE